MHEMRVCTLLGVALALAACLGEDEELKTGTGGAGGTTASGGTVDGAAGSSATSSGGTSGTAGSAGATGGTTIGGASGTGAAGGVPTGGTTGSGATSGLGGSVGTAGNGGAGGQIPPNYRMRSSHFQVPNRVHLRRAVRRDQLCLFVSEGMRHAGRLHGPRPGLYDEWILYLRLCAGERTILWRPKLCMDAMRRR